MYLYGALAHSAPYMKDDSRIATWGGLATEIVAGIQREDDLARYGNSPSIRSPLICAP